MKTQFACYFIVLGLFAGSNQAAAQGMQFFRISGPSATTLDAFRSDGTLVWSNALAGTNYTVQAGTALPGGGNWVDYVRLSVTQAVNTNLIAAFNPPAGMALIPDGVFSMGDTLDGESDALPKNVTVSGFYMDVNLVSYRQWQTVYSYAMNHGYDFVNAGADKAADHPVQTVDWYDALKWCNARSQLAGLTPVYYTDAGFQQVYTNGDKGTAVYANWKSSGYRLPTEAEWEKAARGGLNGQRFPWGDTISEKQANYFGATAIDSYDFGPDGYNASFATGEYPYTSPVGYFMPNGYGLYDMAGNVFEWCWDWYGTPYAGGNDPLGPASGIYRVLRGGCWNGYPGNARCSGRAGDYPTAAKGFYGFRCVQGF
jgi:formylglycine-generating enzyme required for sulfatase activity